MVSGKKLPKAAIDTGSFPIFEMILILLVPFLLCLMFISKTFDPNTPATHFWGHLSLIYEAASFLPFLPP